MRKRILAFSLIIAGIFFHSHAECNAPLHEFMMKYSECYSPAYHGKTLKPAPAGDVVNSRKIKDGSLLVAFWKDDETGRNLVLTLDSIRNRGAFNVPVMAVCVDGNRDAVAEFAKTKRIRIAVLAGDDARKYSRKAKAGNGTAIVVDADGKIVSRWDKLTKTELLRWPKVSTWVMGIGKEDISFENLMMQLKGKEYGRGLFISEMLDWNDENLLKWWMPRLDFLVWAASPEDILAFSRRLHDCFAKQFKDDTAQYARMISHIGTYLTSAKKHDEELARFGLGILDEILSINPDEAENFIITDQRRIFCDMMEGTTAQCRELAEKAMAQARAVDVDEKTIHPDTYKYLQLQIDKYNHSSK